MGQRPTPEEARRALLDLFRTYDIRSGHSLPVGPIFSRLIGPGRFDVEEIMAGKNLMVSMGEVEERDGGEFLTAAGYAAI